MIYEFHCLDCDVQYEELSKFDETGEYASVVCPNCQSIKKEKLMSVTADPVFINPEGTRKWINDSTGHDYRFKHAQPRIAQERAIAEAASHVGSSPYKNIDDISSGKYFGEVK